MRFSAVKHLPLLVVFLAVLGCGNPQEEARQQLGQMNIKFTEDSFITEAREGNVAAVKLFLQAGMKPDVANGRGETPSPWWSNTDAKTWWRSFWPGAPTPISRKSGWEALR